MQTFWNTNNGRKIIPDVLASKPLTAQPVFSFTKYTEYKRSVVPLN